MNCHGDQNDKGNNQKNSSFKHMLHMVICCGIPIIIIFSLPFIAKVNPGMAVVFGIIAPFICPVMMIGMMAMMFRSNKKSDITDHTISNNQIDTTKE